jgi:MFS family permease
VGVRPVSALRRMRAAAGSTYRGLPQAFWWLWLSTLVNRLGSLVLPLFAFYLTGPMHRTAAFAGLIGAVFGFGAASASLLGGVLADRLGRKPTLVGSLLANAASMTALGFARSPAALALCALAVGTSNAAFRPALSAMIADMVPAADRTRAYALNFWAINLGFAFAMSAVGLADVFGYHALFYGDAGSTVLCALIVMVKVADTTPERHMVTPHALAGVTAPAAGQRDGLHTVFRDRAFVALVAAAFVTMFVYSQCNAGMPMEMARDGLSAAQAGWVGAINGVVIVLLQLPMTRWLGRYAPGRVLAASSIVIGAGFAVLLIGHSVWIYALSCLVWTFGEIGYTPTTQAVVAKLSPAHLRGRYQGMYQLSWTAGSIAAPLVGGAVLTTVGAAPLWLGCLGLTVVAASAQLRIGARIMHRLVPPVTVQPIEIATATEREEPALSTA